MMNKEKAREKIEKWLEGIPKSEMDMPYFEIPRRDGSQMVSTRRAIEKLSKDQKILNFIADKIVDQLDPNTDTPLIADNVDDVIKAQFDERYKALPEEYKKRPLFGIMGREAYYAKDISALYDKDENFKKSARAFYHTHIKRLQENE